MTEGSTSDQHHRRWLSHSSARADLSPLDTSNRQLLLADRPQRRAEAGTLLAASGEPVDPIFVVLSGDVHLAVRNESGGRHVVAVARAGSVVGDIALLCEHPWPFDVLASTEISVIAVPANAFIELLQGAGDLAVQWSRSIAKRLEASHRRQVSMLTKDLRARVATSLLEERTPKARGRLEVCISQDVIGQLVGARRQSVANVLADFRAAGLVDTRYGTTVILNAERLAQIAGEPLDQIPCASGPSL